MIRHPLLDALGVAHGFGERDDPVPEGVLRPRQVHGNVVVRAPACTRDPAPAADAVLGVSGQGPVAVVTADCVPVLLASACGSTVAAVHAGWRGLAAGILEAAVQAVQCLAPTPSLIAVIGPHIGPCCYEIDTPVLTALRARHGARHCARGARLRVRVDDAVVNTRGEHMDLDLGALTRQVLEACGVPGDAIGQVPRPCTRCDASRFHSYRRDGPRAGRLLHHIRANPETTQG